MCDEGLVSLLSEGCFEPDDADRVFWQLQGFCERCMNNQTGQFLVHLQELEPFDEDGFALVCCRYIRTCERLLFFRGMLQLPREKSDELERELKSYVVDVLRNVMKSIESDDAAYAVRRLEKQWLRRG